MTDLCPAIDRFDHSSPVDFQDACDWVVRRHLDDVEAPTSAGEAILIVTHREGIRQLAFVEERLRLPYCAIARFEAHVSARSTAWSLRGLVT